MSGSKTKARDKVENVMVGTGGFGFGGDAYGGPVGGEEGGGR